jgi:ubiquinone biosynthesis protein UbiJ
VIRLPDRAQLLDRLAQAITRMLATDAPTVARLRALDGRVMALRLSGFATGLYVAVVDGGLLLATTTLRPPDVTLEGRLADFLAFARARQAREAPGAGKLRIQGDLGTAQAVQRVLDELAIDWEELLVPYLGDVVAHQLGRGMRVGRGRH